MKLINHDLFTSADIHNTSFWLIDATAPNVVNRIIHHAIHLNHLNGSGSFTIQASTSSGDAGLGGSTVVATITVNAVNDAPTLGNGTLAAVLVGALCGMIGVYIVLRGMSYIGHGLSHAIFGGAVVAPWK